MCYGLWLQPIIAGGAHAARVPPLLRGCDASLSARLARRDDRAGLRTVIGNVEPEELNEDSHHDHLIDVDSGEIVEFLDEEIERLQMKVAKKLGYELVDHKMELFGKKISK